MKLFLASAFDKTAVQFQKLNPSAKKVLFIANAAEPWGDVTKLFWVNNDREAFVKFGYEVADVDLHTISPDAFQELLASADVVHICGGGVFYINELLKDRGVHEILAKAVKGGEIVYTGTSAGAIIPSKLFSCYEPESEEVAQVKRPMDKVGLGLIDFVIVPHNNTLEHAEHHAKMVPRMVDTNEALFFIRDNQAVWVDDGGATLVSV